MRPATRIWQSRLRSSGSKPALSVPRLSILHKAMISKKGAAGAAETLGARGLQTASLHVHSTVATLYGLLLKTLGGIPPDAIRILGSDILKVVFAVVPEGEHRIHVFSTRDH
jgi:hypothetical protein